MRPRLLLNLLQANAKRGEFRAQGNTIYLYAPIVGSEEEAEWFGGVSPQGFIRELSQMTGAVNLRINSPGGDVFGARAMAQHMREYAGEITVQVDGVAASAATFLAVSGAKTLMAPGAMMMIHKAATIGWGNADDMRSIAGLLDKVDGTIADTYAAKSGKAAEDYLPMMAAETWFTAAEAIEAGLADDMAGAKVENVRAWDLSAYDRAPEALKAVQATPGEVVTITPANPVREEITDTADLAAETEQRARALAVRLLQPAA